MSENEEKVAGSTDKVLSTEIEELEKILSDKMEAREKSLKTGFKIRVGFLIFAVCYCAFLYHLAYGFTSDEAIMMMRAELDAQLPTMQADAIENMKKSAPEVVDTFSKNLVSSIPDMRRSLQDEVLQATSENIVEIEKGLNDMCNSMLADTKAELDKMGTKMTTAEKVKRLGQEMSVKMFEESREIVDGVAKEYTKEIRQVNDEIKRLQTAKNLTPKEKHQKELLRISSKLMQMKLKDVNKDFQATCNELGK